MNSDPIIDEEIPTENEQLMKDLEATNLIKRSPVVRKNKYKNKPCFCGSGKKTKYCCWTKLPKFKKVVDKSIKLMLK